MKIIANLKRLYVLLSRIWKSQKIWNMLYEEKEIARLGATEFYSRYGREIACECGENLRVNARSNWGGQFSLRIIVTLMV